MNYRNEYEVVYKLTNGSLKFVSIKQVHIVDYIPPTRNSIGSQSAKPTKRLSTAMLDRIASYSSSISR